MQGYVLQVDVSGRSSCEQTAFYRIIHFSTHSISEPAHSMIAQMNRDCFRMIARLSNSLFLLCLLGYSDCTSHTTTTVDQCFGVDRGLGGSTVLIWWWQVDCA